MILLFLLVIAVGIVYLVFKTGGFLLDGFTSLINRIVTLNFSEFTEFSSSEILLIILLSVAFVGCLRTLKNIIRR